MPARALLVLLALPSLLAAALAATPGALGQGGAGAAVDLVAVEAPERTAAGHAFPVEVTLANKGDARRTVYLFAALYEWRDGKAPCGGAQDPAFRGFTHLVQPRLDLGPRETVRHPPEGERWLQRYDREDVAPQPRENELCVFVAEDQDTARLQYLDLASVRLSTRGANGAPTGDFSWSPRAPHAAQDVRFEASFADPEGDPLTYRWDFGHPNASGRAVADGPAPTHFFYPEGTFTVTLAASDGFDEARVAHDVVVAPEPPPAADVTPTSAADGGGKGVPLPWLLTALALALAARAASRRPR